MKKAKRNMSRKRNSTKFRKRRPVTKKTSTIQALAMTESPETPLRGKRGRSGMGSFKKPLKIELSGQKATRSKSGVLGAIIELIEHKSTKLTGKPAEAILKILLNL